MIKRLLVSMILFYMAISLSAQDTDFRSPFDFKMYLSGTFAELRGGHFHSGIDIKTKQTIGHPVYAIADGWVSRVKVRAYGFGHAIYITHPSGYTSVYAHLNRFAGDVADAVEKRQYAKESFYVDFYPSRSQFAVKKGDIIGYSGNSGSSGGPHLHFEIREAISQNITNVLKYGYHVDDNIPPIVQRLRFYPIGEGAAVNGSRNAQSLYVFKSGKNITPNTSRVKVSGDIAFGIQTIDKLNGAANSNGPYKVTMYADSIKFWEFVADKFSFAETRYLNAMIDYPSYSQFGHKYYMSYLKPGNRLSMLAVKDKGLVHFAPGQKRKIRIEVEDYAGNKSIVKFELIGEKAEAQAWTLKGKLFNYNSKNYFSEEGVKLSIPARALYDTLDFRYAFDDMPDDGYSKVHQLHKGTVPMHKYATVSLKVDRLVHNGLKKKLTIVRIDEKGRKHDEGGDWNNGWLSTKTRYFGDYVVMADTTDPVIKPINIYSGKTFKYGDEISFRITDDFTGIDYYRAEVDGKWMLFKYYPMKNRLIGKLDEKISKGSHNLRLVVADEKGNTAVYKTSFTIQ